MTILRGAFSSLDTRDGRADWEIAATAVAMATWHGRAAHCPICGSPTVPMQGAGRGVALPTESSTTPERIPR